MLPANGDGPGAWPLERPPQMLETSVPGVFAVGDARRRAVKRVASAVGDGSVVVSQVHQHLTELRHERGQRVESGHGARV